MRLFSHCLPSSLPWTVALALFVFSSAALAAPPIAHTVPRLPADPTEEHDIISGRATTLKGAVDAASIGATWTWDPGDGSGACNGSATSGNVDVSPAGVGDIPQLDDVGYNPYWAVWCQHTYAGNPDDIFIATLTVNNGIDAPVSNTYRMIVRPNQLPFEINAAIDEALWHMHRNQFRFDGTVTGDLGGTFAMGAWDYPQTGGIAEVTVTAASVNAFEARGYFESGPATSPYTETVARGLKWVISRLDPEPIAAEPAGDPDTIPNGIGIGVVGVATGPPASFHAYKQGMVMDAIVASGTPAAVATTGPAQVIDRNYGEIIQDMVDYLAWSQIDPASSGRGGWDYNADASGLDNSIGGWSGIGLIAAENEFGSTIPGFVKTENQVALESSDTESASDSDGMHGYRSTFPIWGPYATSAAALVQMAMDDIDSSRNTACIAPGDSEGGPLACCTGSGVGTCSPDERWIRTENFFRRDFNDAAIGNNFKNYYYAMFNFAKAMRLARPAPVVTIGNDTSAGFGVGALAPIDWYADLTNGLARTVIDYQVLPGNPSCGAPQPGPCPNIGGFTDRPGNSHGTAQDDHNTPWATQILIPTIVDVTCVAQAEVSPQPGAVGQPIEFDASASSHPVPERSIVLCEWDFDDDGIFDASGFIASTSFGSLGTFPVTLRCTDDDDPVNTCETVVEVDITNPPHPPTANAGGPYEVCIDELPLTLDGTGSFDINEGQSESGNPPFDTITLYEWELDGVSPFAYDEATGPTASFDPGTTGEFDVGLRVTDNTAASFPSAMKPNLTDTDNTIVTVCDCAVLTATAESGQITLSWSDVGAAGYNVYRSTSSGGPYTLIGSTTTTSFVDTNVEPNVTYYYVVRDTAANGDELCQSNEASATLPPDNGNPVCDDAVPSRGTLWPPDHKLQKVSIVGVTDPDPDDVVSVTVTAVRQDEPVNFLGDGDTCPDAKILGATAKLRRERSGTKKVPGDGRVYHVGFTASDGQGGECSGEVQVCVPHDQSGAGCVDQGALVDSTACN